MSFVNADDLKSRVLSQDLLIYITHLEKAFSEIEESDEKNIIQVPKQRITEAMALKLSEARCMHWTCMLSVCLIYSEWLLLILENCHQDVTAARIRNMALSQLLMNIECNKLLFPFSERPSRRAYDQFVDWLKATLNRNIDLGDDEINDDEPTDRDLKIGDFEHLMSADNRTYVAVRTLPNNGGVFGYVAVTVGDGGDMQWLDSEGRPMNAPYATNLPVQQVKSHLQTPMPVRSDIENVWYVLKNRKPLSLRNDTIEFYQSLYEHVQQEMLAEKNNDRCTNPFIDKLLKFLQIDLKAIGITDIKVFDRLKMLSMLKKQIKTVMREVHCRSETLETALKVSSVSPIVSLPQKCCYDFVSNALWKEVSEQRPSSKYMEILSNNYPQFLFPMYFSSLNHQKKKILAHVFSKYCKILDEMFADLDKAIMSSMKKYKDARWEWHLAYGVIDEYSKEKSLNDSLCAAENSVDETEDSFLTVILNEIEMAHKKLKFLTKKNEQMTEQLSGLRIDVGDKEQMFILSVNEHEEKMDKLKSEINIEKRDIMKREYTISELQRKIQLLKD